MQFCRRQSHIYIYIYAFIRRFYPKRLTLHSSYSFYILSALAFPGNRTHDLGVASAMLYQLSYRIIPMSLVKEGIKIEFCSLFSCWYVNKLYLSIYPSIYPSIHPSIHLYLSIHPSIHPYLSIYLSIYLYYIAKSFGSPPLNKRFDYFINFHEYKS